MKIMWQDLTLFIVVFCSLVCFVRSQEKEPYISLVREEASSSAGHVILEIPKSRKVPSGWDMDWHVSAYTPKGIRLFLGRIADKDPLGPQRRIVIKIPAGTYKFEITRRSDRLASGARGAFDIEKGEWTWFSVEPTVVVGTKATIKSGEVVVLELTYADPQAHVGSKESNKRRVQIYTWRDFGFGRRSGGSQDIPNSPPTLYPPIKYASLSELSESHLMAALNDDPYMAMAGALLRLNRIEATPLVAALGNKSLEFNGPIARVLAHVKDKRAVPSLVSILRGGSNEHRYLAAWVLGELKDTNATEPLIRAAGDNFVLVRCFAVNALGKIKDKRALDALVRACSDAGRSKGQIVSLADPELLTEIFLDEKFKVVGHSLPIPYYSVRDNAVYALGQLGDRAAIDPLLKLLANKDIRLQVVEALGNYQDPRVVDSLLGTLEDDQRVRWMSVHILGKFRDPRVLPRLTALSRSDPDSMVRSAAKTVIEKSTKPKKK
ncbi:MAG: HEAT repeat domain-containing protein [Ignavibacteria bacterium]|nr:HEAT repeat domain-containing protein [Ignavibacteria bacterium]